MGRIADRIGTRWTVMFGALMIGLGLSISTLGPPWPLWIGHGLFIGLIGLGGINAPLYIYVSRWFDRRRGSALALISSGSYLAGAVWPPVFEQRDRQFRLAPDDAVVCARRGRYHRAAGGDLFSPAARSDSSGGSHWRGFGSSARSRLAAQCGIRGNVRCRRAVLHSHGDAAGPSGRLLQRSRHQPLDERADAVGAARHRVPEPASLGCDLRPHRRSRDRADRIGMAGRVDDGLSADAE